MKLLPRTKEQLGTLWFGLLCAVVASLGMAALRIPVSQLSIGLTEVLFFPLGLSIGAAVFTGNLKIKWSPIYFPVMAYLVAGAASATFSGSPGRSLLHVTGEIYLALLCAFTATIGIDQARIKQLIFFWFVGCTFSIILGLLTIGLYYTSPEHSLLQRLTSHTGAVPITSVPRITAGFASASMYFNYLSVGAILLVVAKSNRWINGPLFQLLIAGVVVVAVCTFSIGLGSVFVIMAVLALWLRNGAGTGAMKAFRLLCSSAAVAWLLLAFIALSPYPEAPFSINIPSVGITVLPSVRYLVWTESVQTFINNFWLGVGPANPVARVIFTNTDGTRSLLTDAHNTFLNVAAERGVFGLFALIITCWLVIGRGWRILQIRGRTGEAVNLAFGLVLAFAVAFVYQGLLGSFEDAKHLWVLLGMIIASEQITGTTETIRADQLESQRANQAL